jgi:hypothetical protein
LEKPNIGLLSKESLEDVRKTRLKNLPIELLERLMRDDTPEEPDHLLQEKKYSGRPLPPAHLPLTTGALGTGIFASQPIHISFQSGSFPGVQSSRRPRQLDAAHSRGIPRAVRLQQ